MRIRRVLTVAVISFIVVGCDGSPSGVTEEPGESSELDCLREGYPCSLGEVPEPVMTASVEALEDGYEALETGDIAGARAVLEARADLAEIQSDAYAIRFRLEGGVPIWLLDVRGLTPDGAAGATEAARAVVGEDTNGDGKVDNRDVKRALVMAPYLWEFQPWDESPLLADLLGEVPSYEGNVRYVGNETEDAQNVTLDDWMSWGDYDAVFVATHGMRVRRADGYAVVISSGVKFDASEYDTNLGISVLGSVSESQGTSNLIVEYGFTADFFRVAYPDGLDDAFVSFAACETGGGGASELADALSGEDFVMMGWTEVVPSDVAFTALGGFVGSLRLGVRAEEALDRIREQGLDRGVNSAGDVAVLTRFAPNGGDQRLIEVPSVLDRTGRPMTDGEDLTASLGGTPGDGDPDQLRLRVRLDGVEEGTEAGYEVSYRLDDQDAEGSYPLADATRLDESAVAVTHDIDLGFDAPTEPAELEAIVALPEGGESRFAVTTQFAVCSFDLTLSGGFSGVSDGPAYFRLRQGVIHKEDGLEIGLNGDVDGSSGDRLLSGVFTAPWTGETGSFDVSEATAANLSATTLPNSAIYFAGDTDCPTCGGTLVIEEASEETLVGSFDVTLPTFTDDPKNPPPPTRAVATFRASLRISGDGSDPYSACVAEW